MEMDFIETIDELKTKYEYNIKDIDILEADGICSHLGFLCYDGICCLLERINQIIEKLKLYKGNKKDIADKYIKEMTESYNYYNNLEKEVLNYIRYYISAIRDIQADFKRRIEIKNTKDFSLRAIKEILNSNIQVYIKYDKEIINLLNKIKNLNFIFNF